MKSFSIFPTSAFCFVRAETIDRDMLHLAFRHHVGEIFLAAAFQSNLEDSSGPEVLLFKRFQAQ